MMLREVWWGDGRFVSRERAFMKDEYSDFYYTTEIAPPYRIREAFLLVADAVRSDTVYCLPQDVLKAKQIIAQAQKDKAVQLRKAADAAQDLYDEMMIQLLRNG